MLAVLRYAALPQMSCPKLSTLTLTHAPAGGARESMLAVLRYVALPLLVGLGLLVLVLRFGKHLVNKPLLCPHAAVTVSRRDAAKAKRA